jgi:CPA2 family monovalent cation:H+ antiporter-2
LDGVAPVYFDLLLLLGVAIALITLFHRLHIAPLLAFIVTGTLFGPSGLGLVDDPEELSSVATLGLSFLLFLLGLEFSLPRLIALRHTVFRLGLAQVGICSAVFAAAFWLWGLPLTPSLLLAGGLALSSTAIVSRELTRLGQLGTRHGEIAIGILLFQDLVAVGLLIAVPLVSGQQEAIDPTALLLALLKTLALLLAFFLLARYLLPRILKEVARHKSDELLVLTALVIVLLCGTLTSLIGLSMELGAFLAGMMLGESSFRHQLEADIRPFRDLLLGLFFISIGMLIDVQLLAEYWFRVLAFGITFLLFKASIIALVTRVMGESWHTALPAGMTLSQGGEFLFALLALASAAGLVPADVVAFLISMTIVSMLFTPLLILHGPRLVDAFLLRLSKAGLVAGFSLQEVPQQTKMNHVVIMGYGRVGQAVASFFRPLGIDYVVLESDSIRVAERAAHDELVYYGDATRRDLLKAVSVETASLVIISFDNVVDSRKILELIRELNPAIPVLIRTRDDSNLDTLLALGATEVIPETHEASLTLVAQALLMLEIPSSQVEELIGAARRNRYRALQSFYQGDEINRFERAGDADSRGTDVLHAVVLTGSAWACKKALKDLRLPAPLRIPKLHRQQMLFEGAALAELVLQHGDIVILQGPREGIAAGQAYLLRGK